MRTVLVLVILLLAIGAADAHLCNNIYRTPDRLVVKPEKDLTRIDKSDSFRIFVKNNYPTFLDNVRLTAQSDTDALTVSISPASIPHMLPGDKTAFTIKLTVRNAAQAQRAHLTIGVSANQIGFQPAQEATAAALKQAMNEGNPSPKVLVAESLARMNDPAGMKFLNELLGGGDRGYKSRAIRAVGRIGNVKNANVLTPMLNDRDGWTKGNALLALGNLKTQKNAIQGCVADRDPFVSTAAKAALAMQGVKTYDKELTSALRDPNEYVRGAAAWGLASRGDKAAINVLDKTFQAGNDDVKIFCGDALIAITERVSKT